MDLQDNQDFQLPVVVVSPELQVSQEIEVKRERAALQGCLCQVPLDVRGLLVPRVNQGSPDLPAFPQQDKTVSPESPGVPASRETEGTQERRARKVRDAVVHPKISGPEGHYLCT